MEELWRSTCIAGGAFSEIPGSSLVVLIGPNGSGKLTLVKIFSGLLQPSRGYAMVYGFKPGSPRARMLASTMFDRPSLYEDLTVRENLEFFKMLRGLNPGFYYGEVLEKLSVYRVLDRKVKELSHGWERGVDVVRAFIGEPRLILIDELATAFDQDSLRTVSEILVGAVRRGSTSLITGPGREHLRGLEDHVTRRCELVDGVIRCEAT